MTQLALYAKVIGNVCNCVYTTETYRIYLVKRCTVNNNRP